MECCKFANCATMVIIHLTNITFKSDEPPTRKNKHLMNAEMLKTNFSLLLIYLTSLPSLYMADEGSSYLLLELEQ